MGCFWDLHEAKNKIEQMIQTDNWGWKRIGELKLGYWLEVEVSKVFSQFVHEFIPAIAFDSSMVGVGFLPVFRSLEGLILMMSDHVVEWILSLQISDELCVRFELGFGQWHVIAADVFDTDSQIVQANHVPSEGRVR